MQPMTEAEARACIQRANDHFLKAGEHLVKARHEIARLEAGEGWRALGYDSLPKCVQAETGYSRAYVYRLLKAMEIERDLESPIGDFVLSESLLRPLSKYGADSRKLLFDFALAWADNNGVKLTAGVIESTCSVLGEALATETFTGAEDHQQLSLYDRLDAALSADVRETTERHKQHIRDNQRGAMISQAQIKHILIGSDSYSFEVTTSDKTDAMEMMQAIAGGELFLSVYRKAIAKHKF